MAFTKLSAEDIQRILNGGSNEGPRSLRGWPRSQFMYQSGPIKYVEKIGSCSYRRCGAPTNHTLYGVTTCLHHILIEVNNKLARLGEGDLRLVTDAERRAAILTLETFLAEFKGVDSASSRTDTLVRVSSLVEAISNAIRVLQVDNETVAGD